MEEEEKMEAAARFLVVPAYNLNMYPLSLV
jgi:hypothetical protein